MNIHFKYRWHNRFIALPWAIGYFLFGVIVTVLAQVYESHPGVSEIILLWSILSFLIAISLVFGRRIRIFLSPAEIRKDGVYGVFRGDGIEFWPRNNKGTIPWFGVKGFEAFSYPDMDSMKVGKKSGVRLISKNGDKIIIYEHINNYGEFLSMVRTRLEGGE